MAATAGMITKNLKGLGGMAFGLGFQVLNTAADFKTYRKQGNGPIMTVAKTVGSFVWWDMLGKGGIVYGAAQTAWGLSKATGEAFVNPAAKYYEKRGRLGAGYAPMTEAGYTMRQRSINAIRQNGLNLQEVFGNEARQYFERY